tara:strand:+ start:929 stop:1366 length:438 start_codon:yes stop_codon:yes gene_type:complete
MSGYGKYLGQNTNQANTGWGSADGAPDAQQSRWQLLFDYACDQFIDIEDPDDWVGREDEWCEAQMEWACNFADERCDDDDDEDDDDYDDEDDDDDDDECSHPSSTQGSDGAYRCDDCGRITYDISDEEFAHQNGGNYTSSDFRGW